MQIPIGAEANFEGIIDLIKQKAYYFDGDNGENIREEEIPAERLEEAKTARHDMIASIADLDDALAEKFLAEQEPTIEELHAAIRRATIALKMTPVIIGSAYKNKGVQLLLDGVNSTSPTRRRSPTTPSTRTRTRRRSSSSPIPRSRSSAWRSSSRTGATGS